MKLCAGLGSAVRHARSRAPHSNQCSHDPCSGNTPPPPRRQPELRCTTHNACVHVRVCCNCLRAGFTGQQQLPGGSAGAGLPSEDSVLPLTINSSHQENEEEEFRRLLYVPAGQFFWAYVRPAYTHACAPPPCGWLPDAWLCLSSCIRLTLAGRWGVCVWMQHALLLPWVSEAANMCNCLFARVYPANHTATHTLQPPSPPQAPRRARSSAGSPTGTATAWPSTSTTARHAASRLSTW